MLEIAFIGFGPGFTDIFSWRSGQVVAIPMGLMLELLRWPNC